MDKQWRPSQWENPYTVKARQMGRSSTSMQAGKLWAIYEAGASAMLEALRNNQLCPFDYSVLRADFKGKVVIIPDEE